MEERKEQPSRVILRTLIQNAREQMDKENAEIMTHVFNEDSEAWEELLNEREDKEVAFCQMYAEEYAHGTSGHNRLMLVAKMAKILDAYETAAEALINNLDKHMLP